MLYEVITLEVLRHRANVLSTAVVPSLSSLVAPPIRLGFLEEIIDVWIACVSTLVLVITSYSIHYTKLYERLER